MEIDFKTKISILSDRQRDWFATAMVAMVLADGDIDRAEVDFLLKVTTLIKDEAAKDRIKKFIQFKTVQNQTTCRSRHQRKTERRETPRRASGQNVGRESASGPRKTDVRHVV